MAGMACEALVESKERYVSEVGEAVLMLSLWSLFSTSVGTSGTYHGVKLNEAVEGVVTHRGAGPDVPAGGGG